MSNGGIQKIKINQVKQYYVTFKEEQNYFENTTYATFKSSYIKRCSDEYISRLSSKLLMQYKILNNSYNKIAKWWKEYNEAIESLEVSLSQDNRSYVKESNTNSYVQSKLPKLENYKITISGEINSNLATVSSPTFANNEVIVNADIADDVSENNIADMGSSVREQINNVEIDESMSENIVTGAEVSTTSSALGEEAASLEGKVSDFFKNLYETGADILEEKTMKLNSLLIGLIYDTSEIKEGYFKNICDAFVFNNFSKDEIEKLYNSGDLFFEYQIVNGQAVISSITLPNGNTISLTEKHLTIVKENGSTWRYGEMYNYVHSVDGKVLKLTKDNQLIAIYNDEIDNVDIFEDFSQYGGNQMYFSECNSEVVNNPKYLELLQKYFPDATLEDVEAFAYCTTQVGCGYVAAVNAIYQYYEGKEYEFFQTFGYPMYNVKSDGTLVPNYTYLTFELAASRYEGCNIKDVYGNIMTVKEAGNGNIIDGALVNEEGKVELDAYMKGVNAVNLKAFLSKFCETHGIDFAMKLDENTSGGYVEENLDNYYNCVKEGFTVMLAAWDFDLYYYDSDSKQVGSKYNQNPVGGHAMSIVGITEDGKYIVSSWGTEFVCDLSNASKTGFYVLKFGDADSAISVADAQTIQNFDIGVGTVSDNFSSVDSAINAPNSVIDNRVSGKKSAVNEWFNNTKENIGNFFDNVSNDVATLGDTIHEDAKAFFSSAASFVTGIFDKINNDIKSEEISFVVDDENYNEQLNTMTSELEQYEELYNTYIDAYKKTIEDFSKYEKQLRQAENLKNSSDTIPYAARLQNSNNEQYYDEVMNQIVKEYGSYDTYINQLNTLKQELSNFEAGLEEVQKQKKLLKYGCLTYVSEFENYVYEDDINYEEIAYFDLNNAVMIHYNKETDGNPLEYMKGAIKNLENNGVSIPPGYQLAEYDLQLINLIDASKIDPTLEKTYSYLYEKNGLEVATQYLNDIESTVNNLLGQKSAMEFLESLKTVSDEKEAISLVNNHLKTSGKGLWKGFETFSDGINSSVNAVIAVFTDYKPSTSYTVGEYENMYILQALQSGEYGAGLVPNYEISQGIGNMLPSILLKSSWLMGLSAAGNSYHNSLVEGYSNVQALTYGLISGTSEALLEKFLGGLPGVGKGIEVSSVQSLLKAMASEGIEEGVQTITDATVRSFLFSEGIDPSQLSDDVIKSIKYGMITAGILQGGAYGVNKGFSAISDTSTNINPNITTNDYKVNKTFTEQINEVNYHTQKGDLLSYTFKLNDISEVTPELLSKIIDPSVVKFEIGNEVYDYIDMKAKVGVFSPEWSHKANINDNQFDDILFEEISALIGKADIQDYYMPIDFNQLYTIMHTNFDNVIGSNKIDSILYSINIVESQNWQQLLNSRGLPTGTLGFVDKNDNLFLPSNASMHTAVHEILHKISNWKGNKVYDAFGNIKNVTGLREFYSNGFNTNITNERITEYFASKLFDNKIYNSQYDDGTNLNLIERLDNLLTYAYKDPNILLNAYVMNDNSILSDFFSKYSTQATYYQFVYALNSKTYEYADYLDSVISELESKFYPKKSTFVDTILSIFKKQKNHEYGIVSNKQQVLKKVCDPINNYSNLDSAVSWFFENNGLNHPRPYDIFVSSIGKGYYKDKPSVSQVKKFLDRFNNLNGYYVENQGYYFTHVFSSDSYYNNSGTISNRLYINAGHDDAYKFVQIFADKCESKGIPFYFKVANFQDMNKVPEISLTRDESIVIYAEDRFLAEYVNICNEIKKENPSFIFYQPPIFTGNIDGFIGYGGESSNHSTSYNSIRSNIITNAIRAATNYFQQIDPNFNFFEMKKNWDYYSKYLDYIYQYIKYYSESMGIDPNNFAFTIK